MGFQHGLSGLNAAAKNLDVIGHNIANSSTTGFKSSRAEFAEMVASSMGAVSGRSNGVGVEVAAIAQQFTQGGINITGNSLDVAINGNGFFVLKQADGTQAYTRAGNFKLDKEGDMRTNGGQQVMGFSVNPETNTPSSTLTPLSFPTGAPIAAKETQSITASLNLDARTAHEDAAATPPVLENLPRSTFGTSIEVFDSQGVSTPVNLYFVKSAANTWDVYTTLDDTLQPDGAGVGQLTFDANGALTTTPSTLTLDIATVNPNSPNPGQINGGTVDLDLSGVTQFGSKYAVSELSQDGYSAGELVSINIADDGMIMASYSNGVTRAEAQVALANFANLNGLESIGDNNWVASSAAGAVMIGGPTNGTFGSLRAGALEESNVDLTAELVNMMTAQRTYQANAQTIKTQDQVLSTLVNLR